MGRTMFTGLVMLALKTSLILLLSCSVAWAYVPGKGYGKCNQHLNRAGVAFYSDGGSWPFISCPSSGSVLPECEEGFSRGLAFKTEMNQDAGVINAANKIYIQTYECFKDL